MYGIRPSLEEVVEDIKPFDAFHTAWLLARINILLALDRFHFRAGVTLKLQTRLVNQLIDDELFANLKWRYGLEKIEKRQPFNPIQVLNLLKIVLVESREGNGLRPDADKDVAHRLGRCLIKMNDLLLSQENLNAISSKRLSVEKRRIALLLQAGSGLEVTNPPPIYTSVVRNDTIFNHLLRQATGGEELRAAFESKTGITLEDYVDHVFGLLTYYTTLDLEELIPDLSVPTIGLPGFFAEGSKEVAQRFWELEVTTVERLAARLRNQSLLPAKHDYIELRKKPILAVERENGIPIHLGFIQEKLESGLFWKILNTLSGPEERAKLFTNWGHLFESYISGLLGSCFSKSRDAYHASPLFQENGEQAFDALIVSGSTCVAVEMKGGFLNAAAKYSEDEHAFLLDLNKKFGSGKGAGLAQLARKIGLLFCPDRNRRRHLAGIDLTDIKTVIPVMIVQEFFASFEIILPNLMNSFGRLKRKERLDRGIFVGFPIILDVSEVEEIRPYLASGKVSFVDCLLRRLQFGSSATLSFGDFFREYRASAGVDHMVDEDTRLHFEQVMNRISQRFFKKPFDPHPLRSE